MFEIIPFIIGVLLAEIAPGPNLMAVASNSLGKSRRGGVATALGIATGVLIWAIAFTFGIAALFEAFPRSITVMKLIGGGYLVYMAINVFWSLLRGKEGKMNPKKAGFSLVQAYRNGLFVVLTNPKTVLMWVAISTYLAAAQLTSMQFLIIGIGISLSAVVVYGIYALLFSTGIAVRAYERFFKIIEGLFGAVFGLFGAKLLLDGVKELRT